MEVILLTLITLKECSALVERSTDAIRLLECCGEFPGIILVPGQKERVHFIADHVHAWITDRAVAAVTERASGVKRQGPVLKVPAQRDWRAVATASKRKAQRNALKTRRAVADQADLDARLA